jgi:hypothetical protein
MDNVTLAKIIDSLGEEQALTTLQAVGMTAEAAQTEIGKAKKIVAEDQVQGVLKEFKDALVKKIVETADASMIESIPDDLDEVSIALYFTRSEKKLENDQTVQAGFYTTKISVKRPGDEKWINLSRKGRSGGNGSGGGGGVPVPTDAPFTSWAGYVEEYTNYHNDRERSNEPDYCPTGKGFSAPVGLRRVKDALYAKCAEIYEEGKVAAEWESVKEFA